MTVRVSAHRRRRVKARVRRFVRPDIAAFHTVTADAPLGHLRSRSELKRMCIGKGSTLFGIDKFLGDDKYVFLSVREPVMGGKRECFVFNAEELIRDGALLRTQDILVTPEATRLARKLMNEYDYDSISKISEEVIQAIYDERGNDEIRGLLDALERKKEEITFRGSAAIRALRLGQNDFKGYQMEILVPNRLPLAKSLLVGDLSEMRKLTTHPTKT